MNQKFVQPEDVEAVRFCSGIIFCIRTYLYCKAVEDGDLMDQKYLPDQLDSQTFVDLVLGPAMVANNPKMNLLKLYPSICPSTLNYCNIFK